MKRTVHSPERPGQRPGSSLARQNALLLAVAFIVLELLVMALFAFWVLLPLGRRSADDLAGLMVLSAQTWAELPPATRVAFEEELLKSHALALRADTPNSAQAGWHSATFYLLQGALARRTGGQTQLAREVLDSGTWYWASVPLGAGQLSVGLAASRINSQPFTAFFVALGVALLLAFGLALWLARRLTQPLARLEAASALIGQGGSPTLLPETGPLELANLSRRFNAMALQVRELLSARTTLLAGVSHDLRTPLARMRLALEMLKDHPSPQLIDRLERDITQMDQLIGNVLALARGLAHEPPVDTNLAELLQQLAQDFSTATSPVSVTCAPAQLPLARQALQRALGNLLQNAQRYAPNLPVELVAEIGAVSQVADNKHPPGLNDAATAGWRIGVLDRGPGIAPEQVEAVFLPFHRLEASRSPATGGTGLGLAIVRELARANGWQVSLQPRPGGGLQAWIAGTTQASAPGSPGHS